MGEVKRQRWKEKVGEGVTVVGRRSFCFCFSVDNSEKKILKNKRRDKKKVDDVAQWLSSKMYCVCVCVWIRMERKWHSMFKGAFNIDNKQLEFMMVCSALHLATKN